MLLTIQTYTGVGGFNTSGAAIFTVTGDDTIELLCSLRIALGGLWSFTFGKIPNPLNCGWCVGYFLWGESIGCIPRMIGWVTVELLEYGDPKEVDERSFVSKPLKLKSY